MLKYTIWLRLAKLYTPLFSRMHATLHPALSVCPLVGLSVSPSHFYLFFINSISLSYFKSFKSKISHSKSFCKSGTPLKVLALFQIALSVSSPSTRLLFLFFQFPFAFNHTKKGVSLVNVHLTKLLHGFPQYSSSPLPTGGVVNLICFL